VLSNKYLHLPNHERLVETVGAGQQQQLGGGQREELLNAIPDER
jgi:hypothetical protein